MKKTILALIAVLILGVGAYYSLKEDEVSKSTMKVEETDFSVKDTSVINRFFIAKKSGGNYQFVKDKKGNWLVNNSWKANKFMVNMILGTISEWKVKTAVPKGMRNGVIRTLAAQGTKVELYTANGLLKTFYVGDYTADEKGTYAILDGSEQPYILHIPRFEGYLTGRFLVTKSDFMDKVVFNSGINEITSLQLSYAKKPKSGFTIVNGGIKGISNLDSNALKQYLSMFRKVSSKEIIKTTNEEQETYLDSISNTEAMAILSLVCTDDVNSNSVKLYEVGHKDNMIAHISNSNEYAWVQHYVFDKFLVEKSSFEKKEMKF